MGKSTISMAIFNSFLYVYQRVSTTKIDIGQIPHGVLMWQCPDAFWHQRPTAVFAGLRWSNTAEIKSHLPSGYVNI